ncbi:MAG: PhzF family phenazine biosynthesis protein [Blastocatellia bacterium]
MEIPIYTIDAFTAEPFKGNPAAVCLLDRSHPSQWMQRVAAEMNLSETAFVVPRASETSSSGEGGPVLGFDLRWFTPTVEVPLCGHATLASAHALWETGKLAAGDEARFHTLSGWLTARRADECIEMDFPSIPVIEAALPAEVQRALGVQPRWAGHGTDRAGNDKNFLVELESEAVVRNLQPDFVSLRKHAETGVIVTAPATTTGLDFVSRYFASFAGIDEDPVTGSAHCSLAPYWAERLGKTEMTGYQASARGGEVRVRMGDGRVLLAGRAVTVLRGTLVA